MKDFMTHDQGGVEASESPAQQLAHEEALALLLETLAEEKMDDERVTRVAIALTHAKP
jgi:ferritin-like metal-binding protein YciE